MSRLFGLFCEGPIKLSCTVMKEVPLEQRADASDIIPIVPDG